MESQPQNPKFRINPDNFHPWIHQHGLLLEAFVTQYIQSTPFILLVCLDCGFMSKSTAIVMLKLSVSLSILFPGQV